MRSRTRFGLSGSLAAVVTLAVAAAASVAGPAAGAPTPIAQTRAADPAVVGGSLVPSLTGVPVGDIVAFRWVNGWAQVPVQIDQRKSVELNTVYGKPANTTNPVNVVVYADPNTFVGAASGNLTSLDVIVIMARAIGSQTPPSFSEPAGVLHNTGVRVKANDPLTGAVGYFYLFRRSGTTLVPGMGRHNVTYTFGLISGPYKTTYNVDDGPNTENSAVSTANYTRHFGDRWLDDVITVKAGTATGADIVDRHKALFAPGYCGRSEDTFDDAEGAFVANVVGPLRAIRSYIGANSGPYTERTHVFYDQREDILTDLRVHAIPSVMDFWDYSPAASGMRYSNDRNTGGVVVDGATDTVASGAPLWEKVGGPQGTVTRVERLVTSVSGLSATNYYYDDDATNPTTTQCTGDAFAYGSSGVWVNSSIPNTDPHNGTAATFLGRDTMYFEPPAQAVSVAQKHSSQISNPLTFSATLYRG
jgi:hypothetical protein